MKKVFALILAAAMMITMTACSTNSTTSSSGTVSKSSDTTTAAAQTTTTIPANTVTGDPNASNAIVVWGWNTDFDNLKTVLTQFYPDIAKRIVFVNAGGSDYYQGKIDEILKDKSNALYPDIMLLEVDYVKKYVNSDYLLSTDDLGITTSDTANMYKYNLQLGTDTKGKTRALFWQATPGSFQIRADLAKQYLGTTDPTELQDKYFSSWDKIIAASKTVNQTSGGKVKLLSGYNDVIRVYLNSARKVGWYDSSDKIQVDDSMKKYMDLSKTLYTDDTSFNTTQWGTDWAALKDGDGKSTSACISFVGCPWYTYWCLTKTWKANTILVQGPAQFYWGGTGLAATVGCSDKAAVGTIIKACTCNAEVMKAINAKNGDFVNNTVAIKDLIASKKGNNEMIYNNQQDILKYYSDKCGSIDASTVTDVDQKAQSLFQTQVDQYAMGKKDMDTAINDFKKNLKDLYSYLKIN